MRKLLLKVIESRGHDLHRMTLRCTVKTLKKQQQKNNKQHSYGVCLVYCANSVYQCAYVFYFEAC